MRCLALAEELTAAGSECLFICREHPGNLLERIAGCGYRFAGLSFVDGVMGQCPDGPGSGPPHANWLGVPWSVDAAQTAEVLSAWRANWLVVDHYALGAQWEAYVRGRVPRVFVVDDLADRQHDCDLLLDQNPGRAADDYRGLVPVDCRVIAGTQLALLRPEFARLRAQALVRQEYRPRRLLVTMGGVDKCDATSGVLEALRSCNLPSDIEVTVVMGGAAPWLTKVEVLAASLPCVVTVRVDVPDMAQLMIESDFSVGAAGITALERCCLGLPSILVVVADNQRSGALALGHAGAALLVNEDAPLPAEIARLLPILMDGVRLKAMRSASFGITDGLGVGRIVQELQNGQ
jgi:UDP-2,4-diacetamido-2,4,6-trideoxy-beta-L-altropyranose hydrolase